MDVILEILLWTIQCALHIYLILAVINIVLYWGMHFNLIGQGGAVFKKFLVLLHQITEPVYAKMREKIKPWQGFDLSPYALIAALAFVLHLLETIRHVLLN